MFWTVPAARQVPTGLGVQDGKLADCPNSPNCVSSQTDVGSQRVEPLEYDGSRDEARERLAAVLAEDPRCKILSARPDYLHAEFKAFVFVDDVEFYFPDDTRTIEVRSASRVGHSDLGANRRRVLTIAKAFSSRG